MVGSTLRAAGLSLLIYLIAVSASGAEAREATDIRSPHIAIIIDDLGYQYRQSREALTLPGAVTFAFLPHTPHAERLARLAHQQAKEVMLHLPMESVESRTLGPGGVTLDMTEYQFKSIVLRGLKSVPYAVGINNHMGSLLTRHPLPMAWLMEAMIEWERTLYFVDSRTTLGSVAPLIASEYAVHWMERDVFLDARPRDAAFVHSQFEQLVNKAQAQGGAIGIAHPYPETLSVLKERIDSLPELGIQLVPVSALLKLRFGNRSWHASSSPSLKVVKN